MSCTNKPHCDVWSTALDFATAFLRASPSERETMRQQLPRSAPLALPNPWRIAARFEGPGSATERAETLLVMQALSSDPALQRESIMGLAVVWNGVELAGLDPADIFEEVGAALGEGTGAPLQRFAARAPEDRSMEAFGLVAVPLEDGGYEIRASW